jgi:hypothetical protein
MRIRSISRFLLSFAFYGVCFAPLAVSAEANRLKSAETQRDAILNYQAWEREVVRPIVRDAIERMMKHLDAEPPALPSDAPNSSCDTKAPPNELEIKVPGGGTVKIKRDPETGRISITIIFPQWFIPNLHYQVVCVDTPVPGQPEPQRVCEIRNAFGATMCKFTKTPPSNSLRMECDSDILGLENDCDLEEETHQRGHPPVPTKMLCISCRFWEKDGVRRENTPKTCAPMDEWRDRLRQGFPKEIWDGLAPLIPLWIPVVPETLPSLFPAPPTPQLCPVPAGAPADLLLFGTELVAEE